ncbi:MAG TPA: LysM peptidoglycan-binding domain-containing protein [Verrucomicrobiae bacterium]
MSTPNPLIPQGTFQAQAAKGASNVRLAVATIVAIHIVFFGGLLLQGCKRDPQTSGNTATDTNSLALPALNTNDMLTPYYPSGGLPPDSPTGATAQTQPTGTSPIVGAAQTAPAGTREELWRAENLSTPATQGTLSATPETNGETKEYTIAKGDTLGAIAKRNNTTLSAIRKANPDIEPTRIRPGQKILIPVGTAPAANSNGSATNGDPGQTYTVKSGDTLTKIASRHNITVSQLRAANNMRTSRVNIGQKLKIPASTNAASVPAAGQPNQVF